MYSCNQPSKQTNHTTSEAVQAAGDENKEKTSTPVTGGFNIQDIQVSDAKLGDFPFFSLPKNIEYLNNPLQRDYDEIYFPLGKDGKLEKIGGKSFKAYLTKANHEGNNWSAPYVLKSYDDAIKSAGGVLVFDGKLTTEQLDFLKGNASYLGEEGSIDYWNEPVRTYIIRQPNGDDIYIQVYAYSSGGSIQVVQKEAFKQTITLLESKQIQKDLVEKGKAVLYINFDTDKSTLKPEGKDAVNEIFKALSENKTLKIVINGYTDNTGSAAHNQELSEERANTVMNVLISDGIDKSRLSARGFGSERPLAANNSEEDKAKNRRVELVKIK